MSETTSNSPTADMHSRHEQNCLFGSADPDVYWGQETADLMKRRQDEEKALRKWRLA